MSEESILDKKSIHELRSIAQSFGISDIFEKDYNVLAQEIRDKQLEIVSPAPLLPEPPKYDSSLMTKAPSSQASPEEIVNLLENHIKQGLIVNLTEERWYMSYGKKTDEGTMRMPLRTVLLCANKLMK